jgi:hypothetical protein
MPKNNRISISDLLTQQRAKVGLLAFILLLTTPRYISKNVLLQRRFVCACFTTWITAGQLNVKYIFLPGR